MCGIAGIWWRDGAPVDRAVLGAMTASLAHRGPDGAGIHVEPGIGLGHRRLSILDLEDGTQPMPNEDGTIWVSFNGEIYNYVELRKRLRARGHRFRTQSDTEVIAHLYEEKGSDALHDLVGMFAISIWDRRRRRLVLARDRLGKKPLYLHQGAGGVTFGSELKALVQAPWVPRSIDPAAIDAFLELGYVPGPATIYRGVEKLPPGHLLIADDHGVRRHPYWRLTFPERPRDGNLRDHVDALEELLAEAVRCRLASDVPLGAFLSGGVDSSLVVAHMGAAMSRPPQTLAVGFGDRATDELEHATVVAGHLRTSHRQVRVGPDVAVLPRIVAHFDEPFADPSALPTYWLSCAARRMLTVVLSGDGGDETLGGYLRYPVHLMEERARRLLPRSVRAAVGLLGNLYPRAARLPRPLRLRTVLQNLALDPAVAYHRDIAKVRPEHRERLLHPEFRAETAACDPLHGLGALFAAADRAGARGPLDRLMYVDVHSYLADGVLVKVDRMSMATGLEVRSPLLDHRIVEFAASLPPSSRILGMRTKRVLRAAVRRHLPKSIAERAKHGFDPPRARWLRGSLRPLMEAAIEEPDGLLRSVIDRGVARRRWSAFLRGGPDESPLFWTLLCLDLWHRGVAEARAGTVASELPRPAAAGTGARKTA